MRFFLTLLALSALTCSAQPGFGIGGYQNVYNRLQNPKVPADTLYNSTGQLLGIIPGFNVQLMYDFNGKVSLNLSTEANLRLYSVAARFKPFQGLGALSLSFNANIYMLLGRPENLDGGILVGLGGGYQLNRTEAIYRPGEFKNYPRSFFPTTHAELYVGLGETYVNRGVFFRFGFGVNGASHQQAGIRFNLNAVQRRRELKEEASPEE